MSNSQMGGNTTSDRRTSTLSRRRLLGGVALAGMMGALAGCTDDGDEDIDDLEEIDM